MTRIISTDQQGRGTLQLGAGSAGQDRITYLVGELPRHAYRSRSAAAECPGVPKRGDPHPEYPAWKVTSVDVGELESGTNNVRRVTCTYAVPPTGAAARPGPGQRFGPATWRAAVRTVTETTTRDWRGRRMRVAYSGTPVLESYLVNTGQVITGNFGVGSVFRASRIAKAEVDRGIIGLTATRWERDDPLPRMRLYENVVNRDPFIGFRPQTVLLDGITIDEQADGYTVTYAMSWQARGWRLENAIEINGQVPQDATVGNGIAFHEVYRPLPFRPLELSR